MKVWSKRFGRLDLKEFLIKLHDIRFELATTVNKALNITRDFQGFGYGYSVPDARAPSLMLAERGSTAARTVNLLNAKGDQIAPRGEKLMIASLLGEKEGVGTELVTRYRQLTAKANEMGMTATGRRLPLGGAGRTTGRASGPGPRTSQAIEAFFEPE